MSLQRERDISTSATKYLIDLLLCRYDVGAIPIISTLQVIEVQQLGRKLFPYIAVGAGVVSIVWAVSYRPLPPADFTFSNSTEIKSVDPAIVTGQPEGCIIRGLFEGLVDWHPRDLHPIPGQADSWNISDDGLVYTFHIRDDARWSDGTKVTAHDFAYSFRRFLDPLLAAEYSSLLHKVRNAEKYNTAQVETGDPVEVELKEPPVDALPHARGALLKGELVGEQEKRLDKKRTTRLWEIKIDGKRRRFSTKPDQWGDDVEGCRQVLLDFEQVAIRAIDGRTLTIELNDPVPYFLNLMGFYPLFPVNKTCVEKYGYPAWTNVKNIVTNGPYVLDFRNLRDRIRMKRNPHYWDQENVHLNTIDAMAVESGTTELNLYMAGKIDWFRRAPVTIIPELLRQNRDDFDPRPYLAIYFYRINTKKKPLDNRNVRRALAMALDKERIVGNITQAGEIAAHRLVPPILAPYEAEKARRSAEVERAELKYDPQRAKELLSEAGFPNGKNFPTIQILYNTDEAHQAIAEFIQSEWKEILNIDVELINKEWGSYQADQSNMDYFVARAGWIGDYADPNTFLDLFVGGGSQNYTGWSKKSYDDLIKAASTVRLSESEVMAIEEEVKQQPGWTEQNHKELVKNAKLDAIQRKRMAYFFDAEQMLVGDAPIIPIYYYVSKTVVRPYVQGFYHNLKDVHPFKGMRIDKEERRRFWASNAPK